MFQISSAPARASALLLALLAGRLVADAPSPPVRPELRYTSGGERLFLIRSEVLKILVEPHSLFTEREGSASNPHEVRQGSVFLSAPTSGTPSVSPHLRLGADVIHVTGGDYWMLHHPGSGALVAVAKGKATVGGREANAGQTLLFVPGEKPVVVPGSEAPVPDEAILQAMAAAPSKVGPELHGAIQLIRSLAVPPYTLTALRLGPGVEKLPVASWHGLGFHCPLAEVTTSIPVPAGPEWVVVRHGESSLSLEVEIESTDRGLLLKNTLIAGPGNQVRMQTDLDTMLVSSQGGGIVIEQEVDSERKPVGRAIARLLSGHSYIERRPPELDPRKVSIDVQGPAGSLIERVDLGLMYPKPGSDPARLRAELGARFDVLSSPAVAPSTPAARLERLTARAAPTGSLITLPGTLPRSADNLFALLALHVAPVSATPETTLEISLYGAEGSQAAAASDRWLHRITTAARPPEQPAIEVVMPPQNHPATTHCSFILSRNTDLWKSATQAASYVAHGMQELTSRRGYLPRAFLYTLQWTVIGLVVMYLLYLAYLAYRWFMRTRIMCPSCRRFMQRFPLGTLDPVTDVSMLEAFDHVEQIKAKEDAEPLVRAMGKKTSANPKGSMRSKVWIYLHWCMRCEEGRLQKLLARGSRMVDEKEIAFFGSIAYKILRAALKKQKASKESVNV